jgi:hypothetical protein
MNVFPFLATDSHSMVSTITTIIASIHPHASLSGLFPIPRSRICGCYFARCLILEIDTLTRSASQTPKTEALGRAYYDL